MASLRSATKDIQLVVVVKISWEKTLNISQSELCNVEKSMYYNNLSVNPKKTILMCISLHT